MVVVRFVIPPDRPHLRASKFERQPVSLCLLGVRTHGSCQWRQLPLWGEARLAPCLAEEVGTAFGHMSSRGCAVPIYCKRWGFDLDRGQR